MLGIGGGGCRIRTRVGLHPNGFQDRPVMTTSVTLRIGKGAASLTTPFLWQREKDSNPHIQSQSLLCYPYTIPLFLLRKWYYTQNYGKVKVFFFFLFVSRKICYDTP